MPRPTDLLRHYARLGAAIRLAQLEAERKAINRAFPGLHRQKSSAVAPMDGAAPPRGRRTLTAQQRKAISDRMKKTWAERRRKNDGT